MIATNDQELPQFLTGHNFLKEWAAIPILSEKMEKSNVPLPKGVIEGDYSTYTVFAIDKYYLALEKEHGRFCNDCKFFNDDNICTKGHSPTEYIMDMGRYETSYMRKCRSFRFKPIDWEKVEQQITQDIKAYFAV